MHAYRRAILTTYFMQEHALHILVQYSALMMCRIYRETETSSWKVEAIGDKLEEGYASHHEPIHDYIANRQRESRE